VGRCTDEGGLPAVASAVGEVVEVHRVVEELLSVTVGLERVRRRMAMEELLVAQLKRTGTVDEAGEAGDNIEGGGSGAKGGGSVEGGAGGKILHPDVKSNSTRFRVSRWGGGCYSFILRRLLVSTDIAQPIPKMGFMVTVDVSQLIPIIFCIGWLMLANTNIAQPINKLPADTTVPTEHHSGGGDCSDREHHSRLFH
jgi:hypothetical protein